MTLAQKGDQDNFQLIISLRHVYLFQFLKNRIVTATCECKKVYSVVETQDQQLVVFCNTVPSCKL